MRLFLFKDYTLEIVVYTEWAVVGKVKTEIGTTFAFTLRTEILEAEESKMSHEADLLSQIDG